MISDEGSSIAILSDYFHVFPDPYFLGGLAHARRVEGLVPLNRELFFVARWFAGTGPIHASVRCSVGL